MAKRTALQIAIRKRITREERVELWVALAKGVKAIKKRRTVKGATAYWVKLEADEEVYRVPPSESALAKLTEYADGKAGQQAAQSKRAAIRVEVLEADVIDGQPVQPTEREGEGFPPLEELDDTNTTEAEAVTDDETGP